MVRVINESPPKRTVHVVDESTVDGETVEGETVDESIVVEAIINASVVLAVCPGGFAEVSADGKGAGATVSAALMPAWISHWTTKVPADPKRTSAFDPGGTRTGGAGRVSVPGGLRVASQSGERG